MKTKVSLLTLAFSLCLVATVGITVSCEKSGPEDEPMVGEMVMPTIIPNPSLLGNEYVIKSDGTTISGTSNGYAFTIYAGAITLKHFNCYLYGQEQSFDLYSSCNLTLDGKSSIKAYKRAVIGMKYPVKLSGFGGSLTISMDYSNFSSYKSLISAAEGYNVTVSDVTDNGKGDYSCTWTVKKKIN